MEDLKKKINFDPSLLYYSPSNKEGDEEEKSSVTNVETYNSTNRKHVCTVCGKRFFSVSGLNSHIKNHPPNERSNSEKDDASNLNRKSPYVWDKGIKCNKLECNFIALDAVEYSKHISSCEGVRVAKGSENVSFCELCDAYFSSENHYKGHLILQHPDCDPDISLKEYDAKHTTISDPVSLYVSENNLENDDEVKQAKSAGHSKYPESFISKKKSKESDIEDLVQNKQETDNVNEEVTVSSKNKPTTEMNQTENIDESNHESVVNIEEKKSTTEILANINDPVMENKDDNFSNEVEKEKTDEISEVSETIASEKEIEVQTQRDIKSKDDDIKLSSKQTESPIANRIVEIEINLDGETPATSIVDKENKKESVSQEKVKEAENSIAETVDVDETGSKNQNSTEGGENIKKHVAETSQDNEITNNAADDSTAIQKTKIDSKVKEDEKEQSGNQEHYMNVEEMMYNLFKDESASENVQKTSSNQNTKSQDLKNDDSDKKKNKNNEEIEKLSIEKLEEKPKSTIVNDEVKNDDSDFEEFDYNRAGKKKYLKSYGRLNKSKSNSDVPNDSKAIRTPEKVDKPIKSSSSNQISKNEQVEENRGTSSTNRIKNEPQDEDLNSSSTDSNIKERSTRTRKKLILPDYEYDSDYKSYCATEGSHRRSDVTKRSSLSKNNDGTAKKRGRPRKIPTNVSQNTTDADESPSSTDISSAGNGKSTMKVKDKIENSYLNTSDLSDKTETVDDEVDVILESIDLELPESISQESQNESVENDEDFKSDLKPDDLSDSTIPAKKKRGRPRKIKREFKRSPKEVEEASEPSPVIDKTAEENIFSDLANALLSLGDPIIEKTKVPAAQTEPVVTQSDKPIVSRVAIIKRRKKSVKPLLQLDEKPKCEVGNEPTFEMKNDVESDLADTSGEVDTNLSFNDANKFEKEKVPEEQMTSFMNDISLVANVSTPKKRGRPPKIQKESGNSTSTDHPTSTAHTKQNLQDSSQSEVRKRTEQMFKSKSANRKSVFLKNKKERLEKMKNHLDSVSFSLLQSDTTVRKRGRPPKMLKETPEKSEHLPKKDVPACLDESSERQDQEPTDISDLQNQNDERLTESPNVSKPTDALNTDVSEVFEVPKKKKGRPRKVKSDLFGSSKASYPSNSSDKDLNLNNLKDSHKEREESPFTYENYHPKKKRSRIEGGNNTDVENIANVKIIDDDEVSIKVPKILKEKSPQAAEPKDETYIMNKSLYLEDVKNRTKYGKQFKRPKNFVYNEKFTDDMTITCGRCKAEMTFRHYKTCHQISHYYLCWIDGEPEINLNDDTEMIRVLQTAITPEALRKKAIRLTCEKCGDVRKSVVGYVSHVRFCQKEDKNNLFETCTLCGRTLRPSSVRFHYIKFHGTHKSKISDGSFASSQNSMLETTEDLDDSDDGRSETSFVKRYRMGFTKTFIQKKDIVEDEQFWTALKTSYDLYMCMGLSCRHMTISKEDLKTHILHCNANFCEFSCSSCPYKTKYENEIIYHSKKNCQETSDDEQSKDEVKMEEVERRVSTRRKKRKFRYDGSNELNETSDEEKYNFDKDFEAAPASDEEEYDSDLDSRKSRSKRKKSDRPVGNVTDKLGLRNAFQQYCLGRSDPLRWTVDLRLKLFSSTPLHVHMKVNTKEWETLPSSEVEKYIPTHQKSMKVCFDGTSSSQFKLFQSDVIKGVPVGFTGGPVWAMAWAPLPAQVTEQYLAVSTLRHMNHVVEINSSVTFPSLIQFWKFSSIDNISNDIQKPALVWSIAHNFGAIWSMEWCPSGGFNNLSTTCRLGILAAATSSGYVVIYNIPKLDINSEVTTEPKEVIVNPKPDLILKIRAVDVQCTRIVWDQTSPHNSLIGGFSDGSIAFWNINTASVLLKKGNVIYPYRTFEAHTTPITALDLHWLNNSRFLLTGALDRVTRYWDLNDLSGPMYEFERNTPVMNAIWMQHWIVTANVHDFGALVGETGAFITHPRDSVEKRKTILNVRDAFWSVSYSLWNDTVAISSNGGYVSVYAAKHLSLLTYKHSDFEKIITSTEMVDLNDEEKQSLDVEELTSRLPSKNDLFDCTSVVKNNGIRFLDRAKTRPTNETISFNIEKCSPTSVNKVCWNQNYNSFNWVAIGYECGFIRVIRVERFDKHYLTKFYKTNENTATLM